MERMGISVTAAQAFVDAVGWQWIAEYMTGQMYEAAADIGAADIGQVQVAPLSRLCILACGGDVEGPHYHLSASAMATRRPGPPGRGMGEGGVER